MLTSNRRLPGDARGIVKTVMADIKIKACDNDLEFNKIKGSHDVVMHRRTRKYYETIPGIRIDSLHKAFPTVFEPTNLSHYHGKIIIPSRVSYKGEPYTVRYLEDELMMQANKIEEISIPGTVREISEFAFCNCYYMTKATLNEGTLRINRFAFAGCYDLREINVPDSVTIIEANAFWCCKNLTTVVLGTGLKSIGQTVFDDDRFISTVICKAVDPPKCPATNDKNNDVFDTDAYNGATLKVPSGSIEKYRNANGWKRFKKIVAI